MTLQILLTIIDLTIVVFLVYTVLMLLRRTHSIVIFRGIVALFGLYIIATYFALPLTHALFQFFFSFFVVILVVVFQREIRRFFEEFSLSIASIFVNQAPAPDATATRAIVEAVGEMAKKKRGALIIIPGKQPIERHLEGGYFLNGEISKPLILSIFDPSSPGHDGALVVRGDKVERFAAQLPLALKPVDELGTRHRAGVGLSERTDALVVIVSEERGLVSLARHGRLAPLKHVNDLKTEMEKFYRNDLEFNSEPFLVHLIKDNYHEKLLAISLAILLWIVLLHH